MMHRREFLYVTALASAVSGEESTVQLSCRLQVHEGRFRFGAAGSRPALDGARFGIDVGGRTLWSDGASRSNWTGPSSEIRAGQTGRLELQFANPRIAWLIDLRVNDDGCSATIASTIRNNGAAPVILGRCRLADYSGNGAKLDIGPGAENAVWLAMTGSQADSRVQKVQSAHKRRSSKILAEGLPSAKWRELVAMGG